MRKKLISCCFGMLVAYSLVGEIAYGQNPAMRQIPGITVADSHPNGCVDCHVNYPDQKVDARFSTMLNEWRVSVDPKLLATSQGAAPEGLVLKGKHPRAGDNVLASIPANCMTCHDKESQKAPPFAQLMHRIHLMGGEQNKFLTVYQGECTQCHKLDTATGRWRNPSVAEK